MTKSDRSAPSAKPLFRAIKKTHAPDPDQAIIAGCEIEQRRPDERRDPLDFDPTPSYATWSVLREELHYMRAHGARAWETAVGAGHIAQVLAEVGFDVFGNDVVDRGWGGNFELKSFLDYRKRQADIQFGNPPYNLISAKDGHVEWMWHTLRLGIPYTALLLSGSWPAARINSMDKFLTEHPPSVEYLCCYRIDFRGGGAPPMNSSWFIWDENRPAPKGGGWLRKRLYKDGPDERQGVLL